VIADTTPLAAGTEPRARAARLPLRSVVSGALVVTLVRPVAWILGLAGFLAGGGLAVLAWPILVLPTPTGLQNALGGPVSTMVFGAPSPRLLALILGAGGATILLLVLGILAGAWAERQGITVVVDAAAEEGLVAPGLDARALDGAPGTARVAALRFLSLAPLALAASLAWQAVYDATYRELLLPVDLVTPLPIRVLGDIPWLLVGLLGAWVASDAAASVGVRRLVLERRPVFLAWMLGWADLVRRPHRVLPVALFGVVALLVPLVPSVVAASVGWARIRDLLASDPSPWLALAAIAILVGLWLGGLVLTGVAAATRAAAWTLELPRTAAAFRHPDDASRVPSSSPATPGTPVTLPDAAPPQGEFPSR
jgi:hypothetical protein